MSDDELEAIRKRDAAWGGGISVYAGDMYDRLALLRYVDALRAKLEVAEAGYAAAVRQAQWQSITNSELNASAKSVDALRAELANIKSGTLFVEQAAIIRNLRAELATATTAYELVRSDCHNLTEKVIPNLRAELAALREAAGKVTCERCNGDCEISETYPLTREVSRVPCPDCADLRKILGEKHE
jgi:excinuclease UvrABC ATPase subunit